MQVYNTQYHRDMPFEDYLKLPGISYSAIKDYQGAPSKGMSLGTKVHNYILEPHKYQHDDKDVVAPIAAALRVRLGAALDVLEKEIAFTSEFHHNGFILQYKGRADLLRVDSVVVDLKVLSGALILAIERFGYRDQVSGYCLATGAAVGLILAYNRAKKRVETETIRPDKSFWQYQVVHRGMPIAKEAHAQ